jgi:hypothetical protein
MIFCAVIAGIFTLLFAVALGCAAKDYEQITNFAATCPNPLKHQHKTKSVRVDYQLRRQF